AEPEPSGYPKAEKLRSEGAGRDKASGALTRARSSRANVLPLLCVPLVDAGMKPEFPWQVKGVRQKARKTAQEAARRSGMSVGKWLDTVITDSAADVGAKTARRAPNDNAARRPPAKPEPRKPEFDEHAQRRKNGDDQHQGGLPPDLLAKVSNRLDKLTHQLDLRERR